MENLSLIYKDRQIVVTGSPGTGAGSLGECSIADLLKQSRIQTELGSSEAENHWLIVREQIQSCFSTISNLVSRFQTQTFYLDGPLPLVTICFQLDGKEWSSRVRCSETFMWEKITDHLGQSEEKGFCNWTTLLPGTKSFWPCFFTVTVTNRSSLRPSYRSVLNVGLQLSQALDRFVEKDVAQTQHLEFCIEEKIPQGQLHLDGHVFSTLMFDTRDWIPGSRFWPALQTLIETQFRDKQSLFCQFCFDLPTSSGPRSWFLTDSSNIQSLLRSLFLREPKIPVSFWVLTLLSKPPAIHSSLGPLWLTDQECKQPVASLRWSDILYRHALHSPLSLSLSLSLPLSVSVVPKLPRPGRPKTTLLDWMLESPAFEIQFGERSRELENKPSILIYNEKEEILREGVADVPKNIRSPFVVLFDFKHKPLPSRSVLFSDPPDSRVVFRSAAFSAPFSTPFSTSSPVPSSDPFSDPFPALFSAPSSDSKTAFKIWKIVLFKPTFRFEYQGIYCTMSNPSLPLEQTLRASLALRPELPYTLSDQTGTFQHNLKLTSWDDLVASWVAISRTQLHYAEAPFFLWHLSSDPPEFLIQIWSSTFSSRLQSSLGPSSTKKWRPTRAQLIMPLHSWIYSLIADSSIASVASVASVSSVASVASAETIPEIRSFPHHHLVSPSSTLEQLFALGQFRLLIFPGQFALVFKLKIGTQTITRTVPVSTGPSATLREYRPKIITAFEFPSDVEFQISTNQGETLDVDQPISDLFCNLQKECLLWIVPVSPSSSPPPPPFFSHRFRSCFGFLLLLLLLVLVGLPVFLFFTA